MGHALLQLFNQLCALCTQSAESSFKTFGDEASTPGRNVDELSNQVGIHPCNEVIRVEVNVLHLGIQFCRDVVTHPLGIHAKGEVLQGVDARSTALAHLLPADRDEAVNKNIGGCFSLAEMKRRWPKEGMKIGDVFANEVVLLYIRVLDECLKAPGVAPAFGAAFVKIVLE